MGATIPRVAPFLASRYTGQETQIPSDLARPAGFEPATRCLEGSCSVRLSYGRSNVIVHGEDHVTATRRSQCVGPGRRATSENGKPLVAEDSPTAEGTSPCRQA